MTLVRPLTPLLGVLLLLSALLVLSVAVGPAAALQQAPEELEQAIEQYITTRGEEFAGHCDDTELPDDIGMWCYSVQTLENGRAEVALGPTFSEFVVVVVFSQVDGQWNAVGERPIPPPGNDVAPPATGTGSAAGSGRHVAAVLLALAGLSLTVSAAAFLSSRQRRSR
jgi:hypothetical protein